MYGYCRVARGALGAAQGPTRTTPNPSLLTQHMNCISFCYRLEAFYCSSETLIVQCGRLVQIHLLDKIITVHQGMRTILTNLS